MTRLREEAYRSAEAALGAAYGLETAEHTITVDSDTTIRVLESGTGEPIVLVHGSPNNAATWFPLAAQFPDRRCLMVERPGAGLSDPLPTWTDHRSQSTALIAAAMDQLDVPTADVVGSSFGGLYAYNVTLAHPRRVRSLIQLGSPAGPSVVGMPTIFRLLSLPLPRFLLRRALRPDIRGAEKMYREIGHGTTIDAGRISEAVFEWYSSLLCDTDTATHLLGEIRAIATPFGFRSAAELDDETLAGIDVPVLHLWGSEDTFADPSRGDALARLTPAATIEHLPGYGHLPWYDDPAEVADRIRTFTSSNCDGPGGTEGAEESAPY